MAENTKGFKMKKYILLFIFITGLVYGQAQILTGSGKGNVKKSDSLTVFVTPTQLRDSLETKDSSWVSAKVDSLFEADHIKANSSQGLYLTDDAGLGMRIKDGGIPDIIDSHKLYINNHQFLYFPHYDAAANNSYNTMAITVEGCKHLNGAVGNLVIGVRSGNNLTTGDYNTIINTYEDSVISGDKNIIIGSMAAKYLKNSDRNVIIGYAAGRYLRSYTYVDNLGGNTVLGSEACNYGYPDSVRNSVYIGNKATSTYDSDTSQYEIVIGAGAVGHGTKTATLGSAYGTNSTYLYGNIFAEENQWSKEDSIQGEIIANGTIDDDALDFTDITLTDITDDVGYQKKYAQIVYVAKSNGDYTTITAAEASITDAASDKRYAILIAPGDYTETVTYKDYVDIIGSGRTNTRIIGTSGTVITFPSTKCTMQDIGVVATYGALGANSTAITSACADAELINCDITVTKSSGNYTLKTFSVTGGEFRMWGCRHFYNITGGTTDDQLTQAAITQSGEATYFLCYNNEITIVSDDVNDDLVGFETVTGGVGTYLLENNIINVSATGNSATATGLWLYGTATGATTSRNRITVYGKASGYGYWIDSDAGGATVNSNHNELIVTSIGSATGFTVDTGDILNASYDVVTASTAKAGGGTFNLQTINFNGTVITTGAIEAGVVTADTLNIPSNEPASPNAGDMYYFGDGSSPDTLAIYDGTRWTYVQRTW